MNVSCLCFVMLLGFTSLLRGESKSKANAQGQSSNGRMELVIFDSHRKEKSTIPLNTAEVKKLTVILGREEASGGHPKTEIGKSKVQRGAMSPCIAGPLPAGWIASLKHDERGGEGLGDLVLLFDSSGQPFPITMLDTYTPEKKTRIRGLLWEVMLRFHQMNAGVSR